MRQGQGGKRTPVSNACSANQCACGLNGGTGEGMSPFLSEYVHSRCQFLQAFEVNEMPLVPERDTEASTFSV